MNEQKEQSIFQKTKTWWKKQDAVDKAFYKGSIYGAICATIGACIATAVDAKKTGPVIQKKMDDEYNAGYYLGRKDGQIQAYYDLLNRPEKAFQNMGFKKEDIKRF